MLYLISQRNDANKHGERIDNLETNYIKYFDRFGVNLIPVPNDEKVKSYFELPIRGVILSGGNDIHPEFCPSSGPIESAWLPRDKTEKQLIEYAIEKKLPVLGICRGMQFINAFFGGRLTNSNHQPKVNHKISFSNCDYDETFVNSYHNKGLTSKEISPELSVFAKTDEMIEGIFHPNLPIAGIQWHPERKSPDDKINEKIIKDFINREEFWK